MRNRFLFLAFFLLFVLWVGPSCPGGGPVTGDDGGSGEAADNQPEDTVEGDVDRDLDCNELVDSELEAGGECVTKVLTGGSVRHFEGEVRQGCNDIAVENPAEVTLRLDACLRDDDLTAQLGRPLFDVYYQCADAIALKVELNEEGKYYEFQGDAVCQIQPERISCRNEISEETLCDRPIATFVELFQFTEGILDPEDLSSLPPKIPDPGLFSTASFAALDPQGPFLLEFPMQQIGEFMSAAQYECGEGSVEITCEPAGEAPGAALAGQEETSGTRLTVRILESFPMGTMVSVLSKFSLDPGPVNLKVTQTLAPRSSPLGTSVPEILNLLLLPQAAVLPHIPFGQAGPFLITTQMVVNNPHGEDVDGQLQFFNTADGQPLEVTLENETASRYDFTIGATESRLFEIDAAGVDPPKIAWAFIHGDRTLTAATNFSTLESGPAAAGGIEPQTAATILAEAGIAASGVGLRHVLNVSGDGLVVATAFAIVNPTKGTANIHLRLKNRDESGEQQTVAETNLVLESHHQTARFFDELFGLEAGPFVGTLEINSDTSLSVISIRTLGGLQSSSLPSGTP